MIISDKHILSLQKKTWNSFISLGNHRNISSKVENLCYMWCTSHQTEKSPLKTILMCRINCPFTILSTLGLNIKASQSVRSVTQLCPTRCDPMDWSTPGLLVHHQLPELAQTHVHQVSDAIQPSHPLLSPSPPAFNLSQHQGLFQWDSSSHHMAKVLEPQLHHQPFQWIFRIAFL